MSYNSLKTFIKNFEDSSIYEVGLYDTDGFLMFSNTTEESCKDDNIEMYLDDILRNDCFYLSKNIIYCSIKLKGNTFCILKASSKSNDLSFFTTIIKSSLESRLEIEAQEIQERKKSSFNELLFQKLISFSEEEIEETYNLAKLCNFSLKDKRVVLIVESKDIEFSINNISFFSSQNNVIDFVHILDKHTLCIFKPIDDNIYKNLVVFKETLTNYVLQLRDYYNIQLSAFISSGVSDFTGLHNAYKQCEWLVNIHYIHQTNTIFFFVDETSNYLFSNIAFNELEMSFDHITNILIENGFEVDEVIRISNELIINNFNLSETAKSLFMHKNTLAYKMNKIKELFSINDFQSFKIQTMVKLWNYYITMKEGI